MGPIIADKQQKAEELADRLLGTCLSLHDLDDEGAIEDPDVLEALDDRVRCCECCGWWAETHDVDEEGNCSDCREPGDD